MPRSRRRRWSSRARAAPGGRLLATSLARHEHRGAIEPYGHANLGFTPKELAQARARRPGSVAELRRGHPREAPAAFRSDLADAGEEARMNTLPWSNPKRVAALEAALRGAS
jgi:hypothetical protein